jgi:microcystin-dependent protein
MDEFMATIKLFAGNFAPEGWMYCHGQTLAINSNTALFSLLGTTYGGNGQTTFCLPDLRSRVPVGAGQGTGLSPVVLGQLGGAESKVNVTPSTAGGTQVNQNREPYLGLNYIICVQGIYPPRSY